MSALERVLAALHTLRLSPQPSEYDLHAHVAACLRAAGISPVHEVPVGPGRRIDFVCEGVGIEIKRGKPAPSRLNAQVAAYARSEAIHALIVLVERNVTLPRTLHGKPVHVISLNRLWGIALP